VLIHKSLKLGIRKARFRGAGVFSENAQLKPRNKKLAVRVRLLAFP
jgi:hypothetical protein